MNNKIQKLGIAGTLLVSGCTNQSFLLVNEDHFKPSTTGLVVQSFPLASCDREDGVYITKIICPTKSGYALYTGETTFTETLKVKQTQKHYPIGQTVDMKEAAQFFTALYKEPDCNVSYILPQKEQDNRSPIAKSATGQRILINLSNQEHQK